MTETVLSLDGYPSLRASARMLLEDRPSRYAGREQLGVQRIGSPDRAHLEPRLARLGPVRDRCNVRGFIPRAERSGIAPVELVRHVLRVIGIFGELNLAPVPEDHRRVLAVLAFLRA